MANLAALENFEQQYQEKGMLAQRMYPNEALLCFLGGDFFGRENKKDIKILEIGCGSGANLWMIAKEGFDAYGMDGSKSGIVAAKEMLTNKWHVSATLKQGLFDDIPFDDDMFDAVIDVVSMQHINLETSNKALKEIKRVLKPGGKFFSYRLSDHSVMYEHSDSQFVDATTVEDIVNLEMPLAGNKTISFWSPAIVRQEYGKVGLKIREIERNTRTYRNGLWMVEYLAIVAEK